MRVAHLITRMIIGGAQENTLYNCQDLIRLFGDEVLLVTGPSLGPEGDLLAGGRAGEVPVERVPSLRRAIHPWRDAVSYRALKRILARFRPDVVHTHSAKAGVLGRLAAWRLGVPAVVHTVHGAPWGPYDPWPLRELYRWSEWYAARHCHALISVADAMTDLVVAAGIAPREKCTTIYSGMEVEPLLAAERHRAAMRAHLGLSADDLVVGKIARLFPLKGHADLIRAAVPLVREFPQLRFLLVGDGILRTELMRQVEAAGLAAHVRFVGLVPPEQIPAYLAAMDVVVHVSLREGLPRALVQALIAGRPVVAYDVDGAREVAISGRTGFLVPPRWEALIEPLRTLLAQADLRRALGRAGQELLADRFRHENMTRQVRALYERVLAQSGASPRPSGGQTPADNAPGGLPLVGPRQGT
jgi:glycosyltransferase involved in cell wall biosynthesis